MKSMRDNASALIDKGRKFDVQLLGWRRPLTTDVTQDRDGTPVGGG